MLSRKAPMLKGRRHGINPDLAEVARVLKTLVDPYRPELHYMRGPGPKWHAKHRAGTPEATGLPGLVRIKG